MRREEECQIPIASIKNKTKDLKVVKVIFRKFLSEEDIAEEESKFIKFKIWLYKRASSSYNDGVEIWDHVELITPERERVSIRIDEEGVYCHQINGLHADYIDEVNELRYTLIFEFEITNEQENKLNKLINAHLGEKYSENVAYWNCFVNKAFFYSLPIKKQLMVNDWDNRRKRKKRWDCATLILRMMREIGILPKYVKGKEINILGLLVTDVAGLLLKLYKDCVLEKYGCILVVSKEIIKDENVYNELLYNFYKYGTKQKPTT